jgi:hypothetical protein
MCGVGLGVGLSLVVSDVGAGSWRKGCGLINVTTIPWLGYTLKNVLESL